MVGREGKGKHGKGGERMRRDETSLIDYTHGFCFFICSFFSSNRSVGRLSI